MKNYDLQNSPKHRRFQGFHLSATNDTKLADSVRIPGMCFHYLRRVAESTGGERKEEEESHSRDI